MKFQTYISEKLNPSEFRDYVKAWKESGMNKQFDDVFKGKDRIYLDYTPVDNTPSKYESAVSDYLSERGWTVTDYIKGYAKKANRTMKIAKVLLSYIDKNHPSYADTLLTYFQRDEVRQARKGEFLICISRHAYDVAGMSTDRGWTSCQDLRQGDLAEYVLGDVKAGSLIAYLIRNDDKNIEHPLGRVLLKPYFKSQEGIKTNPERVMIAVNKKYGEAPLDFVKTVQKWADENLNKGKYGFFKRHQDVFPEGPQSRGIAPKDKRDEFFKKYEVVIDNADDLIKIAKDNFHWLKEWYKEIYDKNLPTKVWFNYDMKMTSQQMLDYFIAIYNHTNRLSAYGIFGYSLYPLHREMGQDTLYVFLKDKVLDKDIFNKINTKEEWDENKDVKWLRPNERDRYWGYFQRIKKEVK